MQTDTLETAFIEEYGDEVYETLITRCGHHAIPETDVDIPSVGDRRLIFTLFELLEHGCYTDSHDCDPPLSEAAVTDFITDHPEFVTNVLTDLPSRGADRHPNFDFVYPTQSESESESSTQTDESASA